MKKKINMLIVLRDNSEFYSKSKIKEAIQKKFDTIGFRVQCFWKEEEKIDKNQSLY